MSGVHCFVACLVGVLALIPLGRAVGDEPAPSPEDTRPVGFPIGEVDCGARGRFFRVTTTAEPTSVEAEEPFTFTVHIAAAEPPLNPPHRIDLADIPAFDERFYILEGAESSADSLLAVVLSGLATAPLGTAPLLTATALAPHTEWVFVYRLKPKNATITEVPVFTFAYFDPTSTVETPEKRWHVPYADAIAIRVQKRAAVTVPLQAPEWAFRLTGGDLSARHEPWTLPGPLTLTLLLIVPPLLGLCWYLGWRRLYPDAARLSQLRRSAAAHRALERIARARGTAPAVRADNIAVAVAAYLRERFDFPAVEPTPTEVRGHLERRDCSAPLIEQATSFFRASDAARFRPGATEAAGLAATAEKFILVLEAETNEPVRTRRPSAILAFAPLLFTIGATIGAEPVFPPALTNAELAERGVSSFEEGVRLRASSDAARPHFHDAARCFDELRRRGSCNPALFRNLGNAHLLADELGPAIFAYRLGLRLAPQDTDLRAGLAEARRRVSYADNTFGRPPRENRPPWLPPLRTVWIFIASAVCYTLGWTFLTCWLMLRTGRPLALGLAALVVAAGLSAFVVIWLHGERDAAAHPLVVIVQDGVLLLKGDGPAFPARYETPVNQGVEARLLFERNGWLQIELSGGEVGWVARTYALVDDRT